MNDRGEDEAPNPRPDRRFDKCFAHGRFVAKRDGRDVENAFDTPKRGGDARRVRQVSDHDILRTGCANGRLATGIMDNCADIGASSRQLGDHQPGEFPARAHYQDCFVHRGSPYGCTLQTTLGLANRQKKVWFVSDIGQTVPNSATMRCA
nr:hypothetical protein [Acidisoma sp. L85]